MSLIPLCDLSISQVDMILTKLHLKPPPRYDKEERLDLLFCSAIFLKYLSGYDKDTILAKFNRKGEFVDVQTSDEAVEGIFVKTPGNLLLYPCVTCAGEVTDNRDKSGFGLRCSGCENFFHNICIEKPINVKLYDLLKDSPSINVKIFCPNCNKAMNDVSTKLKRIDKKVSDVTSKV